MTRAKISKINVCNDTDLLDARPMKIWFSYDRNNNEYCYLLVDKHVCPYSLASGIENTQVHSRSKVCQKLQTMILMGLKSR
ncbi:hypothetical protein Hanom_Chr13g01226281 [Helianthus anomalus]